MCKADHSHELDRRASEADHWCMVFCGLSAKFLVREPCIAGALIYAHATAQQVANAHMWAKNFSTHVAFLNVKKG